MRKFFLIFSLLTLVGLQAKADTIVCSLNGLDQTCSFIQTKLGPFYCSVKGASLNNYALAIPASSNINIDIGYQYFDGIVDMLNYYYFNPISKSSDTINPSFTIIVNAGTQLQAQKIQVNCQSGTGARTEF